MTEDKRSTQIIRRVLVVEDDLGLADMLLEVLTFENCAVELASNGMEAMEKLRGADFDAVVCDLMMPRFDGEELYNQTVKDYPFLADKFLFVTGHASRRAGFSDFIQRTGNTLLEKPFEVEELREALKELFMR